MPKHLDYGMIDMDYVTATQLTIAVSQLAYVLTAALALDPGDERVDPQTYDDLLEKIPEGECYFGRLEWSFHRILSKSSPVVAELRCTKVLSNSRRLVLGCYLDVNDGAATARMTLFLRKSRKTVDR